MKLSSISTISIFMLLTACGINIFGNAEFEEFFKKQPKNTQGSKSDLENFWNTGHCFRCNLRGFDLREAIKKHANKKIYLVGSNCRGADLSNSNMAEANLSNGIFDYADFKNSNLEKVYAWDTSFIGVLFIGANMQSIIMTDSNIEGAHFNDAILRDANLRNATINETTTFHRADCAGAANFRFKNIKNPDDIIRILKQCKPSAFPD